MVQALMNFGLRIYLNFGLQIGRNKVPSSHDITPARNPGWHGDMLCHLFGFFDGLSGRRQTSVVYVEPVLHMTTQDMERSTYLLNTTYGCLT
jgi:hypothetical protein